MKFLNAHNIQKYKAAIWITVIFGNILMFSYITDRSPFSFMPEIPIPDGRSDLIVYLPDVTGDTLLKESRKLNVQDYTKENLVAELVKMIIKGSDYENTRILVPINGFVRKVWFYNKSCIIDFDLEIFEDDVKVIKNSEERFQKAITKTIQENIPGVENVFLLEHGVPFKKLWN